MCILTLRALALSRSMAGRPVGPVSVSSEGRRGSLGAQGRSGGLQPSHPPFPGAAPVPGGRAEAGAQRAGPGGHQPGPAGPGAAA